MKKPLMTLSLLALAFNAAANTNHYDDIANAAMNGGFPTIESQQALQTESYFQRATMVYQWALPIVNMKAMQEGHAAMMDGTAYNKIAIYEDRLKPNTLITTPNSDVIYGMAWLDMKETGPLVMEHAAGLQSLVDDMYHHPLIGPDDPSQEAGHYLGDIGNAGPDKGQDAKFLLLPPGHSRAQYQHLEGEYFIYESNTSEVFLFLRSFFSEMDNLQPAVERIKQVKIYPLKGQAKKMEYHELSDVDANAIWPTDDNYFFMLDRAVQKMELATFDPYMNGVMNALGIKKGVAFNPSDEQKVLLKNAAKTGWKISKETALNYDQRPNDVIGDTWFWKDATSWVAHAYTNNGDQNTSLLSPYWRALDTGYTAVDAQLHMFTNHYSISNMMINAKVKAGAKYSGAYKDSDGNPLTGQCNYKITLPKDVPAGLFWSLTAYDAVTAAGVNVQNHDWPSLGDRDNPVANKDGSYTFFFGPDAPRNEEQADRNWIQFDNESWFSIIRLYAPLKPLFTGEWQPGEFEKLNCK